jgi:D-lactate dehydrogenase (cytochrome)
VTYLGQHVYSNHPTCSQHGRLGHFRFFLAMFISSLKAWLHNSPRLFLTRSGPPALIVPRCQAAPNACRRRLSSESFSHESGAHSTVGRNDGKRTIYVRLLLSSLASGIVGYAVAQTTGHWHLPGENVTQGAQYGTSEDVEKAIKELRSAFLSKDVVTTDPDDLCAHGVSQWDHRTGVYNHPLGTHLHI